MRILERMAQGVLVLQRGSTVFVPGHQAGHWYATEMDAVLGTDSGDGIGPHHLRDAGVLHAENVRQITHVVPCKHHIVAWVRPRCSVVHPVQVLVTSELLHIIH